MGKIKYYSLDRILSYNARYNLIIGERSNGKTYACLKYCLEQYFKKGHQFAIIRRWQDDFKNKRGATMFDGLIANGVVKELSHGEWTSMEFQSGRWWLTKYDEDNNKTKSAEPIGYAFALSSVEHDKSTSYPKVKTIVFDEFLTRMQYLPNEFFAFMSSVSTIVRHSDDIKIFMCGNTVSQYSPYFTEMGLYNIKKMKQGDIDIYTYGDSGLLVAVEFSTMEKMTKTVKKPSDVYFAFNNPHLDMIKGVGAGWEMDIYPHLPIKYKPNDIRFTYFIIFDGETLQCEIINVEHTMFTYIHRKTTPIQDENRDIIFTPEMNPKRNYNRRITHPMTRMTEKICKYFNDEMVYYQDNEIGEIVRNYIRWCKEK